jgi:hypothetical protein
LVPYWTRFSYWNRRIPVLLARIARNGLKVSMSVEIATLRAGAASAAFADGRSPSSPGAASPTVRAASATTRRHGGCRKPLRYAYMPMSAFLTTMA